MRNDRTWSLEAYRLPINGFQSQVVSKSLLTNSVIFPGRLHAYRTVSGFINRNQANELVVKCTGCSF